MKEGNEVDNVLLFDFALENENGNSIDIEKGNELMEAIVSWAEKNNCQVGGGYRFPKKGEFNKELFSIKSK